MNNSKSGRGPLYHPRLHWMVLGVVALAVVVSGVQMKLTSQAATHKALYTSVVSTSPADSDLTVALRLNSDEEPVNVVSGEVTYPANMEFVSANVVGAAFTNMVETTSANGRVKVVVSTPGGAPAIKGDNLIATLTFHAITPGSGAVNVDKASLALSSVTNTNILTTYSGHQVTITNPKAKAKGLR